MPEAISTLILKSLLSLSLSTAVKQLTGNIRSKFDLDFEGFIFKLVQAQNREFKTAFPEAGQELSQKEMLRTLESHFGQLAAKDLDQPIDASQLAAIFADLFLLPRLRASEKFADIDPKYRKKLIDCADTFVGQFKSRIEYVFRRNTGVAMTVLMHSMAQTGKSDADALALLQEIHARQIEVPEALTSLVQLQLWPAIKDEIETQLNRFRDDWPFILRVVRHQTSATEEFEREWLEQLAQVLEWKGYTIQQRSTDAAIPGVIFLLEKIDDFGLRESWQCWGCPTQKCPDKNTIRIATSLLNDHPHAKAFVISHSLLDHDIIGILEGHNIKTHLTLTAFVQTLLNLSKHRQTVVSDYERQPICHQFIELKCHQRDAEDPALELRELFYQWLQQDGSNHISLLGDFGTGKTEFCHRMQWELLKNYTPEKSGRIPVLITLREQKGVKLPQMISDIMNIMGLKQIDYTAFRTLNRMGLFVVLIDGFDEMATHASIDDMIANFRHLAVLAEGRSRVFLTSRTHYFEHAAREKEVMSLPEFIAERSEFQTWYLNPFTRSQIEAYLDKVRDLRKPKRDVLAEMDRHPTLQELMQTPVLLDMILKIFPELMDAEVPITLALVYDKATARWLAGEQKKGHLLKLEPTEVRQFMEELAAQMNKEQKLVVHFKDLKSQTYRNFHQRMQVDSYDLDAFYGEIRTCTFLNRDGLGNYKFAHRSFMEYFAASHLMRLLLAEKAEPVAITEVIRQFMHYLLLPQVDYAHDPRFQYTGPVPKGMEKCTEHRNCYLHLEDSSHMVWIPPGQFIAGGEYDADEKPTRILRLEQGAFLDKYLVTNAQYARFLNETGCFEEKWLDLTDSFKGVRCRIQKKGNKFEVEAGFERHPVNFVSYYGAEAYAKWAGKEIPSEWLWEKAGRGIDGRTYPWGEDWDRDKCNTGEYWAKRDLRGDAWNKWWDSKESEKAVTTPVDLFADFSGPFGCCDLSGNVWEWMKELWKKGEEWQVVRGAAFSLDQSDARLACRYSPPTPEYRASRIGFRLSRTS